MVNKGFIYLAGTDSTAVQQSYFHSIIWACVLLALLCPQLLSAQSNSLDERAAYKLGPEDQIFINVFGEPNLSMEFRLNDTGTLNYPFLGPLKVEGLSVVELEQLIASGLKGPYLVNPDVTVSIKEYRPFYVDGEVKKPGGIPYQPGLTLQRAIALGGGFTERASKSKVTVMRATSTAGIEEPISMNDPVYPGDVVNVPQSFF